MGPLTFKACLVVSKDLKSLLLLRLYYFLVNVRNLNQSLFFSSQVGIESIQW